MHKRATSSISKLIPPFALMLLFCFLFLFSGCGSRKQADSGSMTVAVSIPPLEAFVRAVAGEIPDESLDESDGDKLGGKMDLVTLIPPGYSPENYEPTPSSLVQLSKARILFTIGVPAEGSIIPRLKDLNPGMKIVHLEDIVGEKYPHRYFDDSHEQAGNSAHPERNDADAEGDNDDAVQEEKGHSHEGFDPHIWLSPKRAIVMVEAIADELSALYRERAERYRENTAAYCGRLSELDETITGMFEGLENRTFLMYHPALGYFADDYGLEMLTLEEDGKEPSAKSIRELVDIARNHGINAILHQTQVDSGVTKAFAAEIGATVFQVDPLSADYIDNLLAIAETLKEIMAGYGG